jgi:ABC-2 type transport system ATP-binding protein
MAVLRATACAHWYGPVLGLAEVSLELSAGVTGLLGPNGAGKSTFIKLAAGLCVPSRGQITVLGEAPHRSVRARRHIGHCPEHDSLPDELTALEFVAAMAELGGVPRQRARAAAAAQLDELGLGEVRERRLRGFSKGMRQRVKLAQALVHDPTLLLLDEPLTGVDPVLRADICARIRALGAAGKTVVVSSHVLSEIEAVTEEIVVLYRGQVLAEGNFRAIRGLIDQHPHRIRVVCDQPRLLAARLVTAPHVVRVTLDRDALVVETAAPDRCYDLIAELVVAAGLQVTALGSQDDSLAAVFSYLTGAGGRVASAERSS